MRPFDNQIIISTISLESKYLRSTPLSSSRSHRLLPTFLLSCHIIDFFLPSCDRIDYFLPSYLLAITSTTSYLPTFLRPHRLLLTFFPTISTTSYLPIFLRSHRLPAIDIHIVDLSKTTHTRSAN